LTLQDEGVNEDMRAPEIKTSLDPTVITGATAENKTHRIPDFLSRLHQIDSFNWQKNNTRGQVLKIYRFPNVLLAIPSIREKVSRFYGMRGGIEFVVLIQNQKFQAGNLLISYLPNAKYNSAKKAMHDSDLQGIVTRSGSPRVNLDLMDDTRASLTVPFSNPFVFYNLLSEEGTIGDFYISVYSVLQDVAASGTVSVRVYARFIDADPEFPTGELPAVTNQTPLLTRSIESFMEKPSRKALDVAKQQIEDILSRIDNGELTIQVNTNTSASGFKQKALPHMTSSNDSDLTHMLSTHSNNSLRLMSSSGAASSNEMSFIEMLRIPCYHDAFSISTADSVGTNKWTKSVTPLVGANITNIDSSISADYIFGLANLFKKWRGSIIYRFRAVKTRFHSVRIRVWFSPGSIFAANVDRDSVYSKIVDLEVENSFTFEVPFMHPYNWLNTQTGTNSLGIIGVDVENPMVAPETVASSIDIVVERFVGEDFKFNLPNSMQYFPFNPTIRTNSPIAVATAPKPVSDSIVIPNKAPTTDFIASLHNFPADLKQYVTDNASSFTMSGLAALNEFAKHGNTIHDLLSGDLRTNIGIINKALKPKHIELRTVDGDNLEIIRLPSHPKPFPTYSIQVNTESAFSSADLQLKVVKPVIQCDQSLLSQAFNVFPWYKFVPNNFLLEVVFIMIRELYYTRWSHKKDLTNEGIEPNPGPIEYEYQIQVNQNEQDMEREGVTDHMLTNPIICKELEPYCLGNNITHVKHMINRSTLYSQISLTNTNTIHLLPHAFGICDKNVFGSVEINGTDNLSYFANFYTFARGGVNFRLQTTGSPYRVLISPNNDIDQTANQSFKLLEQSGNGLSIAEKVYSSNLIQQSINTSVEGFGEFNVPFYSSTYAYSVNPRNTIEISKAVADFTHPDTHTLIFLQGDVSDIVAFRNASNDFEFSYLSGPPILLRILP
jgi:hypothetical protein